MQKSQLGPNIDNPNYHKALWSLCDFITTILDHQLEMYVKGDDCLRLLYVLLGNFIYELIALVELVIVDRCSTTPGLMRTLGIPNHVHQGC